MPRKAAALERSVELDRPRIPTTFITIMVVGILLTTGAVLWGRSDTGVIDVSATVANSKYVADNQASGNAPILAPTQEHVDLPNGGLMPPGGNTTPAPTPEPTPEENASTTATTTEEGDPTPAPTEESIENTNGETEG